MSEASDSVIRFGGAIVMRLVLVLVALACLLLSVPALADVDLPVSASSSVKGTIAPEGETEVFSFDATAGTLLSLSLAGKKSPDLRLQPELRDPVGALVSIGAPAPAAKIKAVTPDGSAGFSMDNPKGSHARYGMTLFVRPPPAK